jgi:hypothetical protein
MQAISTGTAGVQQMLTRCDNRGRSPSHCPSRPDDFIGHRTFAGHRCQKRRDVDGLAKSVHDRTDAVAGVCIGEISSLKQQVDSVLQSFVHVNSFNSDDFRRRSAQSVE